MDCRHDRRPSTEENIVCLAALGVANVESIAASASECSITTSIFKLSLYGAGQASSIEQESFNGKCPNECILSIFYGNGPMGRIEDEAAALEQDIQSTLCDVQLPKANGNQLRCELVVPSFALFYVHYAPHALEGGVSRRVVCNPLMQCRMHADVDVMAQGSQCKRISVYCV